MTQAVVEDVKIKRRVTAEVAEWLKGIEDKHGNLDVRLVVDEAADPNTPGYAYFEWDDTVAGAAYRLEQARTLIRKVKFEVWVEDVKIRTVQYAAHPDAEGSAYLSVPRIRKKGLAAGVMAAELARIMGNTDRSLSIARAKAPQLPDGIAEGLEAIREQVAALLSECRS